MSSASKPPSKKRRITPEILEACKRRLLPCAKVKCTAFQVAAEMNISYRSLKRHLDFPDTKFTIGPRRFLSVEEEESLVSHIQAENKRGRNVSGRGIIDLAAKIAEEVPARRFHGKSTVGRKWLTTFNKRHAERLELNKSKSHLSYPKERILADANPKEIQDFFHTVGQYKDLAASRIFDLGECRFYCQGRRIMLLVSGSADGRSVPPFAVMKGKVVVNKWVDARSPQNAAINVSENGDMTMALFELFVDQHFLRYTKDVKKPAVLVMDGKTAHDNPQAVAKLSQVPPRLPLHPLLPSLFPLCCPFSSSSAASALTLRPLLSYFFSPSFLPTARLACDKIALQDIWR